MNQKSKIQGSSNSFDSDIATIRVSLLDEVQFSLVCRPKVGFLVVICVRRHVVHGDLELDWMKMILTITLCDCVICWMYCIANCIQFAFCPLWSAWFFMICVRLFMIRTWMLFIAWSLVRLATFTGFPPQRKHRIWSLSWYHYHHYHLGDNHHHQPLGDMASLSSSSRRAVQSVERLRGSRLGIDFIFWYEHMDIYTSIKLSCHDHDHYHDRLCQE